jgi:hypothetical protein
MCRPTQPFTPLSGRFAGVLRNPLGEYILGKDDARRQVALVRIRKSKMRKPKYQVAFHLLPENMLIWNSRQLLSHL